ETIDYAMPILQALPAVRAELPDMPILVDSGFRRGADALKALALGASGVGIATLLLIACAGGGRDGVRAMMEALYEELARKMSPVCSIRQSASTVSSTSSSTTPASRSRDRSSTTPRPTGTGRWAST